MRENFDHPAVAAAAALDRVGIPELELIDALHRSTPNAVVDQICPGYRKVERSLQEKIGTIDFELQNSELRDLIYEFMDLRSVLIWRLAGPIFLRLAGLKDDEIARVCSTLAIGVTSAENRYQI
jgi:hypothetical protein